MIESGLLPISFFLSFTLGAEPARELDHIIAASTIASQTRNDSRTPHLERSQQQRHSVIEQIIR